MSVRIQRIDENRWRIARQGKMRVPGLVFASAAMMEEIRADASLEQVANVAQLPGILEASHGSRARDGRGQGFPIRGSTSPAKRSSCSGPQPSGFSTSHSHPPSASTFARMRSASSSASPRR